MEDHTERIRLPKIRATDNFKFTDKYISNLKPSEKIVDIREGGGFGIRILPSGIKTFFYIYRFDGCRRFFNLGHYGSKNDGGISLADSRKKYIEALNKVANCIDPVEEKKNERFERIRTPIVSEFVKEYISRYAKNKKRSWKEDERALNAYIVPKWGRKKITDIRRRDIHVILDELVDRGAPIMANRLLAYTRKMFSFAVERHVIEVNPFLKMGAPAKENDRERYLSVDEIKKIWPNIERAKMSDGTKRALKLILVTAQRPGEIAGMHRQEIDGRWWTIPSERSKNKQAHRVYLTDLALKLIGDKKGYIFPSARTKDPEDPEKPEKPMTERALSKAIARSCPNKPDSKIENLLQMDYFIPHDLRRTASTFMGEIGIDEALIDKTQNHIAKRQRGVTHIYNRYKYDKEKKAALEAWEQKLLDIIG